MNQLMIEEALAAPRFIQKHLENPDQNWKVLLDHMKSRDLVQLVTIARGSSDHAAHFMSYALARHSGLIPASLTPSLITLHRTQLHWKQALVLAISQSGASPDLCQAMQQARDGGALTLALINQPNSPLARIAEHVLPMGAGEEKSVAATKSFLLSLVNALILQSHWTDDRSVQQALQGLPWVMEKALRATREQTLPNLVKASSVIVLSRGQGLSIAQEIALKFNEVCRLPALAYSAAEFRHGPMALIRAGDPVLVIGFRGPEMTGLLETVDVLREIGAAVTFVAPEGTPSANLPYPVDADVWGDPLIAAQILYPLIARLALARGYDPDQPAHLRKVTMTL